MALSRAFQDYIKNLDILRIWDSAKFYKIINSLLKYKVKGKVAKGVKIADEILVGKGKRNIVKQYYIEIYKAEIEEYKITNNSIFDFTVDIDRAIESIAKNKAVGFDLIPGEMYKNEELREELKTRLAKHFKEYIFKGKVPKYFMISRLLLISKTKDEYPEINNTRPISILPTITKMFEASILHNLEKVVNSSLFNRWQRGFIKGESTLHNIQDILSIAGKLKEKRKICKSKTATIVFFDFKKAYDMVDRNILVEKLINLNIPYNITCTIKDMLDKFILVYEGTKINTQRGLVQGSVLSPLLFNLFINDLMWEFELNKIEARAYADDVAWIWESIDQTRLAIDIMKQWSTNNKMIVNPQKSGIMRILNRRGKCNKIQNSLDIPEVDTYWYLGVTLSQTLKPTEHEIKIRNVETFLCRRIGILRATMINTKSRFLLFETIMKSKVSYAWAAIWSLNMDYITKWESMIYRLLKRLFCIKTNVEKQKLFDTLLIENGNSYTERILKKIKIRKNKEQYLI